MIHQVPVVSAIAPSPMPSDQNPQQELFSPTPASILSTLRSGQSTPREFLFPSVALSPGSQEPPSLLHSLTHVASAPTLVDTSPECLPSSRTSNTNRDTDLSASTEKQLLPKHHNAPIFASSVSEHIPPSSTRPFFVLTPIPASTVSGQPSQLPAHPYTVSVAASSPLSSRSHLSLPPAPWHSTKPTTQSSIVSMSPTTSVAPLSHSPALSSLPPSAASITSARSYLFPSIASSPSHSALSHRSYLFPHPPQSPTMQTPIPTPVPTPRAQFPIPTPWHGADSAAVPQHSDRTPAWLPLRIEESDEDVGDTPPIIRKNSSRKTTFPETHSSLPSPQHSLRSLNVTADIGSSHSIANTAAISTPSATSFASGSSSSALSPSASSLSLRSQHAHHTSAHTRTTADAATDKTTHPSSAAALPSSALANTILDTGVAGSSSEFMHAIAANTTAADAAAAIPTTTNTTHTSTNTAHTSPTHPTANVFTPSPFISASATITSPLPGPSTSTSMNPSANPDANVSTSTSPSVHAASVAPDQVCRISTSTQTPTPTLTPTQASTHAYARMHAQTQTHTLMQAHTHTQTPTPAQTHTHTEGSNLTQREPPMWTQSPVSAYPLTQTHNNPSSHEGGTHSSSLISSSSTPSLPAALPFPANTTTPSTSATTTSTSASLPPLPVVSISPSHIHRTLPSRPLRAFAPKPPSMPPPAGATAFLSSVPGAEAACGGCCDPINANKHAQVPICAYPHPPNSSRQYPPCSLHRSPHDSIHTRAHVCAHLHPHTQSHVPVPNPLPAGAHAPVQAHLPVPAHTGGNALAHLLNNTPVPAHSCACFAPSAGTVHTPAVSSAPAVYSAPAQPHSSSSAPSSFSPCHIHMHCPCSYQSPPNDCLPLQQSARAPLALQPLSLGRALPASTSPAVPLAMNALHTCANKHTHANVQPQTPMHEPTSTSKREHLHVNADHHHNNSKDAAIAAPTTAMNVNTSPGTHTDSHVTPSIPPSSHPVDPSLLHTSTSIRSSGTNLSPSTLPTLCTVLLSQLLSAAALPIPLPLYLALADVITHAHLCPRTCPHATTQSYTQKKSSTHLPSHPTRATPCCLHTSPQPVVHAITVATRSFPSSSLCGPSTTLARHLAAVLRAFPRSPCPPSPDNASSPATSHPIYAVHQNCSLAAIASPLRLCPDALITSFAWYTHTILPTTKTASASAFPNALWAAMRALFLASPPAPAPLLCPYAGPTAAGMRNGTTCRGADGIGMDNTDDVTALAGGGVSGAPGGGVSADNAIHPQKTSWSSSLSSTFSSTHKPPSSRSSTSTPATSRLTVCPRTSKCPPVSTSLTPITAIRFWHTFASLQARKLVDKERIRAAVIKYRRRQRVRSLYRVVDRLKELLVRRGQTREDAAKARRLHLRTFVWKWREWATTRIQQRDNTVVIRRRRDINVMRCAWQAWKARAAAKTDQQRGATLMCRWLERREIRSAVRRWQWWVHACHLGDQLMVQNARLRGIHALLGNIRRKNEIRNKKESGRLLRLSHALSVLKKHALMKQRLRKSTHATHLHRMARALTPWRIWARDHARAHHFPKAITMMRTKWALQRWRVRAGLASASPSRPSLLQHLRKAYTAYPPPPRPTPPTSVMLILPPTSIPPAPRVMPAPCLPGCLTLPLPETAPPVNVCTVRVSLPSRVASHAPSVPSSVVCELLRRHGSVTHATLARLGVQPRFTRSTGEGDVPSGESGSGTGNGHSGGNSTGNSNGRLRVQLLPRDSLPPSITTRILQAANAKARDFRVVMAAEGEEAAATADTHANTPIAYLPRSGEAVLLGSQRIPTVLTPAQPPLLAYEAHLTRGPRVLTLHRAIRQWHARVTRTLSLKALSQHLRAHSRAKNLRKHFFLWLLARRRLQGQRDKAKAMHIVLQKRIMRDSLAVWAWNGVVLDLYARNMTQARKFARKIALGRALQGLCRHADISQRTRTAARVVTQRRQRQYLQQLRVSVNFAADTRLIHTTADRAWRRSGLWRGLHALWGACARRVARKYRWEGLATGSAKTAGMERECYLEVLEEGSGCWRVCAEPEKAGLQGVYSDKNSRPLEKLRNARSSFFHSLGTSLRGYRGHAPLTSLDVNNTTTTAPPPTTAPSHATSTSTSTGTTGADTSDTTSLPSLQTHALAADIAHTAVRHSPYRVFISTGVLRAGVAVLSLPVPVPIPFDCICPLSTAALTRESGTASTSSLPSTSPSFCSSSASSNPCSFSDHSTSSSSYLSSAPASSDLSSPPSSSIPRVFIYPHLPISQLSSQTHAPSINASPCPVHTHPKQHSIIHASPPQSLTHRLCSLATQSDPNYCRLASTHACTCPREPTVNCTAHATFTLLNPYRKFAAVRNLRRFVATAKRRRECEAKLAEIHRLSLLRQTLHSMQTAVAETVMVERLAPILRRKLHNMGTNRGVSYSYPLSERLSLRPSGGITEADAEEGPSATHTVVVPVPWDACLRHALIVRLLRVWGTTTAAMQPSPPTTAPTTNTSEEQTQSFPTALRQPTQRILPSAATPITAPLPVQPPPIRAALFGVWRRVAAEGTRAKTLEKQADMVYKRKLLREWVTARDIARARRTHARSVLRDAYSTWCTAKCALDEGVAMEQCGAKWAKEKAKSRAIATWRVHVASRKRRQACSSRIHARNTTLRLLALREWIFFTNTARMQRFAAEHHSHTAVVSSVHAWREMVRNRQAIREDTASGAQLHEARLTAHVWMAWKAAYNASVLRRARHMDAVNTMRKRSMVQALSLWRHAVAMTRREEEVQVELQRRAQEERARALEEARAERARAAEEARARIAAERERVLLRQCLWYWRLAMQRRRRVREA